MCIRDRYLCSDISTKELACDDRRPVSHNCLSRIHRHRMVPNTFPNVIECQAKLSGCSSACLTANICLNRRQYFDICYLVAYVSGQLVSSSGYQNVRYSNCCQQAIADTSRLLTTKAVSRIKCGWYYIKQLQIQHQEVMFDERIHIKTFQTAVSSVTNDCEANRSCDWEFVNAICGLCIPGISPCTPWCYLLLYCVCRRPKDTNRLREGCRQKSWWNASTIR